MKFWYFFSALFIVYNLVIFWGEGDSVMYKLKKENKNLTDESYKFSICLPFNEIEKEFLYSESKKKATYIVVLSFLNKTVLLLNNYLDDIPRKTPLFKHVSKDVFNFSLEDSYILNNHGCFFFNNNGLNYINVFNKFSYKIFLISSKLKGVFSEFIYSNIDRVHLNLLKIGKFAIKDNRIEDKSFNKFNCLNCCLKEKNSKPLYQYDWNENITIDLTNKEHNLTEENCCIKKCKKNSLDYNLEQIKSFKQFGSNKFPEITLENTEIEVYPSYTKIDFLLQFIGLITLFFNLSFSETIPRIIKSIFKNKLNCDKKLIFLRAKMIALIISFFVVKEITSFMINEYYEISKFPIKTNTYSYSNSILPLSVILCFPVQLLISNKKKTFNMIKVKENDEILLESYTFEKVYNETNSNLEGLFKMYLTEFNKDKTFDYKLSNKMFLRKEEFHHTRFVFKNVLSRCFQVDLQIEEKYRTSQILLTIKFEFEYFAIYILDKKQTFTPNTFLYKNNVKITKRIVKNSKSSLKSNCKNYLDLKYNCTQRFECVNKCIIKNYLIRYSKLLLTDKTVIDKDDYKKYLFENLKFSDKKNLIIEKECNLEFENHDCEYSIFKESYKLNLNDKKLKKINLYYEIIETSEIEPNFSKLILNLLTVESIFFGSNATKILSTFFIILKLIFKFKWTKYIKQVIFLICLLAFAAHAYVVYRDIINVDLISNNFYKKNKTIIYPDLVFCYSMYRKVDFNFKQTGNYLNYELNFEEKIEKVSYLNENRSYSDLGNLSSLTHDLFKFSTFTYNEMICILISTNLTYERKDFYFLDDPYVLKIHIKPESDLLFSIKKKESKNINEFHLLDCTCKKMFISSNCKEYQINLEHFEIIIEDKFRYLKDPLSFFNKEMNLEDIQIEFKERFGLITTEIPFRKEDNEYEIDDFIFDQYYLKVEKASDHLKNSKRLIYNTYIQKTIRPKKEVKFNIQFSPSFLIKTIISTNDDNFIKLIQNLLNALSLWLNLCLLDLHIYVNRFIELILGFYNKLIKIKLYYAIKINNCLV